MPTIKFAVLCKFINTSKMLFARGLIMDEDISKINQKHLHLEDEYTTYIRIIQMNALKISLH